MNKCNTNELGNQYIWNCWIVHTEIILQHDRRGWAEVFSVVLLFLYSTDELNYSINRKWFAFLFQKIEEKHVLKYVKNHFKIEIILFSNVKNIDKMLM